MLFCTYFIYYFFIPISSNIFAKIHRFSLLVLSYFFSVFGRQGASCHVEVVDLGISSLFTQVYYPFICSLPYTITTAKCVVSHTLRLHSN